MRFLAYTRAHTKSLTIIIQFEIYLGHGGKKKKGPGRMRRWYAMQASEHMVGWHSTGEAL